MDIETGTAGDTSETGFDLNSAINEVAGGLGLKPNATDGVLPSADAPVSETPALDGEAADDTADTHDSTDEPATDQPDAAPATKPPPKSWSREKHELWTQLSSEAQDYYETREKQFLDGLDQYKGDATYGKQLRDVLQPYRPILAAQGVNEAQAVQYLMNAHYQLTQGSREQRLAAYQKLGADLRLNDHLAASDPVADLPPEVRQLQEAVAGIQSSLTAEQQRKFTEAQATAAREVNSFASDPANPYFEEVADDIVAQLQAGHSLKDAYEKAVWANPITRQKEIARIQTESEAKLKEKANKEAEAAKRASSANIRGRETRRAPTEPKGTMEDTMRDTLDRIKNRAH